VSPGTDQKPATAAHGPELIEPGVVWSPLWRPAPDDPQDFRERPELPVGFGGVGRKP
jgi:hypothetical protein